MKKTSIVVIGILASPGYAAADPMFRDHGYSCKENYVINSEVKGKIKTPIKAITKDYLCEPLFSDETLSAALGSASDTSDLSDCRQKMKDKLDKVTSTEALRDLMKGLPDHAKQAALGAFLVATPEEALNSVPKVSSNSTPPLTDKEKKKEDKNFEKNKQKLLDYLFSDKTIETSMNEKNSSQSKLDTKSDGSNTGLLDFAESYDLEKITDKQALAVMKSNADFLGTSKKKIKIDDAKYMSRDGKNGAFVTKATAEMFASIPGVKVSALRFSTLADFHPSTVPDGLEKLAKKAPAWPQYLVALDTSDPKDPTVLFVKAEWKRTLLGKWKLEATKTQRAPIGKETAFKFSDQALGGAASSSGEITVTCNKESDGAGGSGGTGTTKLKSDATSTAN